MDDTDTLLEKIVDGLEKLPSTKRQGIVMEGSFMGRSHCCNRGLKYDTKGGVHMPYCPCCNKLHINPKY